MNPLRDVLKEKGDQRPNKDSDIWFRISNKLKDFDFSFTRMILELDFDALKIYDFILENKSHFPYLAGKKILPLWLRLINDATGIKLKNLNKIPIPIDIHTARVSLKILFGEELEGKVTNNITFRCQEGWKKALEGTKIYPCELDEPLWLIGKYSLLDKFLQDNK